MTGQARAEHHHHHHAPEAEASVLQHRHGYGASLGVVIANYEAPLFSGDYQGSTVGAWWMGRRFGLAVSAPAYHLTKNGLPVSGIGDVMVHAHAMLVARGRWSFDAMVMGSLPTNNDRDGLGMGHVMLMPELGAAWSTPRFAVAGRIGYGAMVGGALAHADHGQAMWPLIDPMNAAEVTASLRGLFALAPTLAAGVLARGAAPVGDGALRGSGGLQVVWLAGRIETRIGVEQGWIGSPFGLRGLVETAIRFD